MQSLWLEWAKRLQALASTGSHFGASEFDLERYAEVAEIANAMLAQLADVPLTSIEGLFPDYGESYATPLIDVRGAVFRNEQILLVQEKSDGLWTLPGGYADVGLSAAENVVKEVVEESGLTTQATHLYAIRHKSKHAYRPDIRDFYKFFFICEQLDPTQKPQVGPETSGAEFFSLQQLPPLSTGRVIENDLHSAWQFRQNAHPILEFD